MNEQLCQYYGARPILGQVVTQTPHRNENTIVPPGLEQLVSMNAIYVEQVLSFTEIITGFQKNMKYTISDATGRFLYMAIEDSALFMRLCCGAHREFTLPLYDSCNRPVLYVSREFKCCAGCCWCAGSCDCCAHEAKITTTTGELLGYVRQKGSAWRPKFSIMEADRHEILKILGPLCVLNGPLCCCDSEFQILDLDNRDVGKITKYYGGYIREAYSSTQSFSLSFPTNTDVRIKALLMGALFLIDFMYFEVKRRHRF